MHIEAHASAPTPPFTECPAVGADTSCETLIVINPGGGITAFTDNTQGPYDSVEDTLIGVLNQSTKPVTSVTLSGTTAPFGFDGDGICSGLYLATPPCPSPAPTGYEGPGTSFSNISADVSTGTVNFSPALASTSSTYFSLEGNVTAQTLTAPCSPSPGTSTTGTVNEFLVPTPDSLPEGIVCGPDKNLWFTAEGKNNIDTLTTSGTFSVHSLLPRKVTTPEAITAGPDGNLWFTESGINRIGTMNTSGTVLADYKVLGNNVQLESITSGPDGNLWFTDEGGRVGRITPSGVITLFPLTKGRGADGIVTGPDGNLWFAEVDGKRIANINPASPNTITEFGLLAGGPTAITVGPDGRLWFTETNANKIGAITTGGSISQYGILTATSEPSGITSGPDGNLYFTERESGLIGQMDTSGTLLHQFPLGKPHSAGPVGITGGPGGLWITEEGGNKIANLVFS